MSSTFPVKLSLATQQNVAEQCFKTHDQVLTYSALARECRTLVLGGVGWGGGGVEGFEFYRLGAPSGIGLFGGRLGSTEFEGP